MCCLIIKPKNTPLPSYTTLRACAQANRHGCGFVSKSGFFKSTDFHEFYRELRKVRTEDFCIIHFRLATHGSVSEKNCHPFRQDEYFFAHNGVLDIPTKNDMTDSETAFKKVILPAIKRYGFQSKKMLEACNDIRGGSRFAIYDRANDKAITLGSFERYEGCLFSNKHFMYYLRPSCFELAI